jgi:hypothetical protein
MEAGRSHRKIIDSANVHLVKKGFPLLNLERLKWGGREIQSGFRKRTTIFFAYFSLVLFVLANPTLLFPQLDLQYQKRGDRYEGVKAKPVSGYDIELLSVLADYQEMMVKGQLPKTVKLRFYLEKEQPVFVTVRELDYRTYYWLDKIQPQKSWVRGFGNEFAWPADPVLKQLTPRVRLYELGALIRLGTETSSSIERVAPAILFASDPPSRVDGYRFTLKTGDDARLMCSVIREDNKEAIFTESFRRIRAGRPFTVHWKAEMAAAGAYRMEISGFFLNTNQPMSMEIRFYHQPSLTS